ncbi:MAG: DUF1207 domain-containing protein [Bacteroidetes bacterium]|nr:DUF1207 domain-containing protein [Bacteroidota bacterium]
MKSIFIIALVFQSTILYSQDTFYPHYIANPLEARVGSFYQPNVDRLRLDIGQTIDFTQHDLGDGWKGGFGTDAFILTRLRSEGNFKFPVETADYFFGLQASAHGTLNATPVGARLRLSHISTHLVDGAADAQGVFSARKPFVYSREFADLSGYAMMGPLRIYAGLTWIWSTQPRNIGRIVPQLGFDTRQSIAKNMVLEAGYDVRVSEVADITLPTHSLRCGLKYAMTTQTGFWFGLIASSGRSIHGMYHTEREDFLGYGFRMAY